MSKRPSFHGSSKEGALLTVLKLPPISRPIKPWSPKSMHLWMCVASLQATDNSRSHTRSSCQSKWKAPQWDGTCPLHTSYQAHLAMPLIHHQKLWMRPHLHVMHSTASLSPHRNPGSGSLKAKVGNMRNSGEAEGPPNHKLIVKNPTTPFKQD